LAATAAAAAAAAAAATTTTTTTTTTTAAAAAAAAAKRQDLVIDPSALRELYATGSTQGTAKNNSQSVIQFLGQYADNADLKEFYYLFASELSVDAVSYRGPDTGLSGVEASLDIQYVTAMGAKVPTLFWSNPNEGNMEPFLNWLADLANTTSPPLVISVSYGDDEASATAKYLDRLNAEFMKAGVRGITIMFASGDSGVGEKAAGVAGACSRFGPDIPAALPSVTAVGGTELAEIIVGAEVCAGLSGGGFSEHFQRQPWQGDAVAAYLAKHNASLPAPTYYNANGRAYPDVAAMAMNFVVVVNLIPTPGVAGTSAASPTYAGVIALLNDARLNAGKKPLGPLNQLLYHWGKTEPGVFHDITSGSNPGCGTDGFHAKAGWDPATGWGSPNFPNMLKAALALP